MDNIKHHVTQSLWDLVDAHADGMFGPDVECFYLSGLSHDDVFILEVNELDPESRMPTGPIRRFRVTLDEVVR